MNKTEPVREAQGLRDFGSLNLPKFGSAELTNLDSARPNESMAGAVRNFQAPDLTGSPCLALPNSETSKLRNAVSS